MTKKSNPLDGLSEDAIRALVESASIGGSESNDSTDEDSTFEIILKGKDANKVLESLGIIRDKTYTPEDDTEPEEESAEEPAKGKSLADKLFGAKS